MFTESVHMMSVSYRIENRRESIQESAWSDFVRNHPQGNFFQSPEYVKFLSGTGSAQPVVLACYNKDSEIVGILTGMIPYDKNPVKRYFSSRIIIWAGPLTLNNSSAIAGLLLDSLYNVYGKSHIFFEFRNHFPMKEFEAQFERAGYQFYQHLNFMLNTESREEAIKRMESGKKRQIRKSLATGATIISKPSLDQVREFYRILEKLYLTRVRKPLPSFSFFESFYNNKDAGLFLLIELKGKIIGGIMCPVFDKRVIYEWYIAGEDGLHDGVYPSTLATWAAIDYALTNGYHHFDFMGAGKPGIAYGVRDFKAKFGGELVNYGRYVKINQPLKYKFAETGLRILRKIKR